MTEGFGQWLSQQMSRRGLTAGRLGKALGCNYATVRAWQVGRSQPGPQLYRRLVAHLGQPPATMSSETTAPSARPVYTFAQWFDAKLSDHHVSNRDLARKLGISATTVTGWRRGEREPMPDTVQRLAELFGTEPSEVLALTHWRIIA